MINLVNGINTVFDKSRALDFLAPLLPRLFLAPIMIYAGLSKLGDVSATAWWFEHSFLKNGIEVCATFFIMLLSLFFYGGRQIP